jgi:hypothetical protein
MDKNILKTVISDNLAEIPKFIVNPRKIHFEDAGNGDRNTGVLQS